MKKVHCKNCKWLIGFSYCTQYILDRGIKLGDADPDDVRAIKINLEWDCPFYNRIWWKIWA